MYNWSINITEGVQSHWSSEKRKLKLQGDAATHPSERLKLKI